MDETTYKQLKKKILEVNAVISEVDPTIRADVFALLKPYLTAGQHAAPAGSKGKANQPTGDVDASALLAAHPNGKPADNVMLVAAYLYGQYGAEPFSATEVKDLGDDFGMTVPNRIDNTLKTAKREGKKLFQKVGKQFKPTVHGESHLKVEYKVTKGNKPRPTGDND